MIKFMVSKEFKRREISKMKKANEKLEIYKKIYNKLNNRRNNICPKKSL